MRQALDRVLGPALDSVLRRLERTVSPDEHRRLAMQSLVEPWTGDGEARVASTLRARLRGALAGEPASALETPDLVDPEWDPTLAEALEAAADEGAGPALPLHLLALTAQEPSLEREHGAWDADLTSFEEVGDRRSLTAPPSLALLAGLRAGRVGAEAARRGARALAHGLEPKHWFPRAGARFGTANLLRTLLATGEPEMAYTADVCERLLRHVEVRRDEALELRSGPRATTWQAGLERLRFTHALLDASEGLRDLRFLNTALKLNDRHHAELGRGGSGPGRRLLGIHYAASVARQESLLRSFFP